MEGPLACDNDHPLEYPNVLCGWSACDCAQARYRPSGHANMVCLICGWEWRQGGCERLAEVIARRRAHMALQSRRNLIMDLLYARHR